MNKTIHLHYFAILREQAGCSGETVITEASDAESLYVEMAQKHSFTLDISQVRVACMNQYCPTNTPLTDGMHLTFLPPVSGG